MTVHTKILPRRSKWTGSTPHRTGVPAPGKNDMGDDHGTSRAPRVQRTELPVDISSSEVKMSTATPMLAVMARSWMTGMLVYY